MGCDVSSKISQFVDFILLNACSTNYLDLNNGKLGLSLCLFEMAKRLNNDSIENIAFELLQGVLALRQKKKNAKPMDIGFTLLYLIEYKFIDADFDDLFGEDVGRLIEGIRVFAPYSEHQLVSIPFFVLLWYLKKSDCIYQLVVEILDEVSLSLVKIFSKIQSECFSPISYNLIHIFRSYLSIASLLPDYMISPDLLTNYIALYKRGRIPNDFSIGFLLEKQGEKDMFLIMQEKGLENVYPNLLTLAQRIDLLYLLNQTDNRRYEEQIRFLEKDLWDWNNPFYEKKLLQSISSNSLIAGYGSGVARLLLYWVYKENSREGEDCSRFKYLF